MSKVIAEDIAYLDPAKCGSTVGYYITINEDEDYLSVNGVVDLTDCSRKITWNFGKYDSTGPEKIDKAIQLLMDFRKEYTKALETVEKTKAKLKAKKEKEKAAQ
jgi:hypothetical protein